MSEKDTRADWDYWLNLIVQQSTPLGTDINTVGRACGIIALRQFADYLTGDMNQRDIEAINRASKETDNA